MSDLGQKGREGYLQSQGSHLGLGTWGSWRQARNQDWREEWTVGGHITSLEYLGGGERDTEVCPP